MKLITNKCSCGTSGNVSGISIISNFSAQPRHTVYEGRDYLVVPVIMLRQAVVNGAFVSQNELIPESWNGVPVTVQHPSTDGEFLSANDPIALAKFGIGRIFNAHMDGDKLRAEAWIDVARANQVKPGLVSSLEANEPMDVSTGYFAKQSEHGGTYKGKNYTIMHSDIKPDHLALLPDEVGACSWDDGCGVRANASMEVDQMKVSDLVTLITNVLSGDESPKIITALIENKDAPFTQEDEATLRAMRLETLIQLRNTYLRKEPPPMATKPKVVVAADLIAAGYDAATAEKMVKAANTETPPTDDKKKDEATPLTAESVAKLIGDGIANALQTALPAALAEQQRPELIARVVANTAHTKEACEKMDTPTLAIIAAGIKPQPQRGSTDFSGRSVPVAVANTDQDKARLGAMVPVNLTEFAARKAANAGSK